jgi:iron complex outermembrane receptor protein
MGFSEKGTNSSGDLPSEAGASSLGSRFWLKDTAETPIGLLDRHVMRRTLTFLNLILLLGVTGLAFGDGNPTGESKPGSPEVPPAEDGLFAKMPVVEAATLHTQTLEEAPASVTVIMAAEIRKYGYRTLGEALGSVRGFYFTNDRTYDYSGVRGLAIPGDYNSRFLVMLNGHSLTENVYNSNNFFGQDFGLDMDLVERIEIVRGPSSALYGSNGMLANINVVTKSPVDLPRFRASSEVGSFGEKKILLSSSLNLGRGANLLISTSVFNNAGRTLYFPSYDTFENQNGVAHHVDAQKGYHTFANLVWGQWSFTGYFNSREIRVPVGGGGGLFDSQGNRARDSRNLVGANYTREVGKSAKLRWQTYYDGYRYADRFDYPLEGQVEDNRTGNWGDWVNSQLSYSFPVRKLGTLMVGIQGSLELRNLQINEDVSPVPVTILHINAPDRSGALFAQQEWSLARHWTAYLGLRFDHSKNFGSFASPRLVLVYQPSQKTSYKLVYGHPFRNPSSYERYYDDNGLFLKANPHLAQETAHAFEVSVERKLRTNLTALVNAYDYRLRNVIGSVWISDVLTQYQDTGARRSTGVEFEVRGSPAWWLEAAGSFVVQTTSAGDSGQRLSNSPGRIGKARLAVPVVRNKAYLSSGWQYLSARSTVAGVLLRPVALADVTLATNRLFRGYDLVCGIRNGLNWQYDQPVDVSVDRIRANGRTFFVKLIWRIGE